MPFLEVSFAPGRVTFAIGADQVAGSRAIGVNVACAEDTVIVAAPIARPDVLDAARPGRRGRTERRGRWNDSGAQDAPRAVGLRADMSIGGLWRAVDHYLVGIDLAAAIRQSGEGRRIGIVRRQRTDAASKRAEHQNRRRRQDPFASPHSGEARAVARASNPDAVDFSRHATVLPAAIPISRGVRARAQSHPALRRGLSSPTPMSANPISAAGTPAPAMEAAGG